MRRAVSDEDKVKRRQELLDAAKRLFAERGYHATTMADVARRAGLSYGVVYWYFDSKDDLFKAMMTAEEEALRARIADALAASSPSDFRRGLEDAVRATFEWFDADRDAAALLFRDSYSLGDDFERHLFGIYGRFLESIRDAVIASQRSGLIREAPPRLVAFSIAALVSQMALRRLSTDDGMSPAEAATFTVDLLFDGLSSR